LAAPDITLEGATINLNAPQVSAAQVLRVGLLLSSQLVTTNAIVAQNYTPGVGNVM
jgi:hypothetical protein